MSHLRDICNCRQKRGKFWCCAEKVIAVVCIFKFVCFFLKKSNILVFIGKYILVDRIYER